MRLHVGQHLGIDALGRRPHRQLAQRRQVAAAEEMGDGAGRLVLDVDLALVEPLDQVLGRQIDQLDLVGRVQHAVRHRLAHADAGDAGDDVVQALQMLDVQRGIDVDPGIQDFLDILVAFDVAAAGHVGVGQLVDDHQARPALQDAVDIHLVEDAVAVDDLLARQHVQPVEQQFGFGPAMGFQDADDQVGLLLAAALRRLQHGIGLPDAGRGAEEYLQPPPLGLLQFGKQRLRMRSVGIVSHDGPYVVDLQSCR